MQVALSRTAWHYRLQMFTFGKVPFTANFCPYFWLTLACLLVLPFTGTWFLLKVALDFFLGKVIAVVTPVIGGVFKLFMGLLDSLFGAVDEKVCKPFVDWSISNIPPEKAFALYSRDTDRRGDYAQRKSQELSSSERTKLHLWMCKNENTYKETFESFAQKKREEEAARWQRQYARQEAERKRQAELKVFYGKVIKVTKVIASVIGIVAGLAVFGLLLFLMYLLITWMASISAATYYNVAEKTGLGIAWLAGGGAICVAIVVAFKRLWQCLPLIELPRRRKSERVKEPSALALKMVKMSSVVGAFFSFFILFAKNFKKDHCPSIDWK